MRVPVALRERFGKREILRSLHTRRSAFARKLAYDLTSQTNAFFANLANQADLVRKASAQWMRYNASSSLRA